jgi:hypothetical protein
VSNNGSLYYVGNNNLGKISYTKSR